MILSYKIDNYEAIEKEFYSLVDTSVDYSDFRINPELTKADNFGKISWGKFTIYHQSKWLLQRRVILKIEGVIKENQLLLEAKYHHFVWVSIVNSIFVSLFSIFMMTRLPIYFGLVLLIITIFHTSWQIRFCYKTKTKLIRQIEEIIKKCCIIE